MNGHAGILRSSKLVGVLRLGGRRGMSKHVLRFLRLGCACFQFLVCAAALSFSRYTQQAIFSVCGYVYWILRTGTGNSSNNSCSRRKRKQPRETLWCCSSLSI